jgi:hypothetical protein
VPFQATRRAHHKAVIVSVMAYACPSREFVADSYLMKLQSLQNKVLRAISNFPRRTLIRDMHVAFQIPYVYDYIQKIYAANKHK